MAFTAAGTASTIYRGRNQFQGLWNDMFAVTITSANPSSVAAGAEDTQTYTIAGLALGDMVLGISFSLDVTINADIQASVSAANTLTIRISNLNGSTALDLAAGDFKVLIARPSF
jgi:hypothetical protein